MANPLLTNALDLAAHTASGVWKKNIHDGIIGRLTPSDPEIKVGATDIFTFTGTPKAELVGEGAQKSSEDGTPVKVTANTYKVQLTYRYSEEVLYADEDYQLRLIEALAGNIAKGISRGIDLVAFHGINPKTGIVGSVSSYLDKDVTGSSVITASAKPEDDIDAAAGALQANGYVATGIAFDPAFAGALARARDNSGNRLYPELGLGFGVERFEGLNAAVSNTVSGSAEIAAESALDQSIIGDWDALKWGIARYVPLEVIRYGDPDGAGDLKRTNEIAIRAEAIFGFAVLDPKAFAIVKKASA